MAEENKKQQAKQIQEQEEKQLVYIGPTLPGGKLKCNQIFLGTEEAIKNEIREVLEENPLVEKMFVEVTDLAEKKQKVKTAGYIYNKYYNDIASTADKEE